MIKQFFMTLILMLGFVQISTTLSFASTEKGMSLMYQGKPAEALEEFSQPAAQGDAKALFYSSLIHLFGDKPDITIGITYLEKAVQKGYGPALDTYAGLYLHGDFVPQDRHKALMYYEIAAQRGYGPSQFNCGILYKNGDKIPQDLEKAFVYLSLAVQNRADLDELIEDAMTYRNQVVETMKPEQYQRAIQTLGRLSKSSATGIGH